MHQTSEIVPLRMIEELTDRVTIDLDMFPDRSLRGGEIGVDLGRLEELMNLAGVASLELIDGLHETEKSEPTVVGYDGQGNAWAGGTKKAPDPKLSSENDRFELGDYPFKLTNLHWSNLAYRMAAQRIRQALVRKGQLHNPEAWAEVLDKQIRSLLLDQGRNNLFTYTPLELVRALISFAVLDTFIMSMVELFNGNSTVPKEMLVVLIFCCVMYSIMLNFAISAGTLIYNQEQETNLPPRCSFVTPGFELGRYLTLVVKSKIRGVFVGKKADTPEKNKSD